VNITLAVSKSKDVAAKGYKTQVKGIAIVKWPSAVSPSFSGNWIVTHVKTGLPLDLRGFKTLREARAFVNTAVAQTFSDVDFDDDKLARNTRLGHYVKLLRSHWPSVDPKLKDKWMSA